MNKLSIFSLTQPGAGLLHKGWAVMASPCSQARRAEVPWSMSRFATMRALPDISQKEMTARPTATANASTVSIFVYPSASHAHVWQHTLFDSICCCELLLLPLLADLICTALGIGEHKCMYAIAGKKWGINLFMVTTLVVRLNEGWWRHFDCAMIARFGFRRILTCHRTYKLVTCEHTRAP
jgi:hypothetical protein